MSDESGPGAGNVIAGIFLILFGLCLALLGGGCTLLMLSLITSSSGGGSDTAPLVLISLAVLGAGIAMIWVGIKLMTGGFNKPR